MKYDIAIIGYGDLGEEIASALERYELGLCLLTSERRKINGVIEDGCDRIYRFDVFEIEKMSRYYAIHPKQGETVFARLVLDCYGTASDREQTVSEADGFRIGRNEDIFTVTVTDEAEFCAVAEEVRRVLTEDLVSLTERV